MALIVSGGTRGMLPAGMQLFYLQKGLMCRGQVQRERAGEHVL